jgi:hypothetical protein
MLILPLIAMLLQQPASIAGRVVRANDGVPVAHAHILLTKVDGRAADSIIAESGDDGTFVIRNIPPATYRTFVDHVDYLRASLAPVTLNAQQQISDLQVSMVATGVISGRVTNEFNEPVSKLFVRVFKKPEGNGTPLVQVSEARTNDLGEYRFYELPPGSYIVGAAPYNPPRLENGRYVVPTPPAFGAVGEGFSLQNLSNVLNAGTFVDPIVFGGEKYEQTYYPATRDAASARALDLAPGGLLSGIDVAISRTK